MAPPTLRNSSQRHHHRSRALCFLLSVSNLIAFQLRPTNHHPPSRTSPLLFSGRNPIADDDTDVFVDMTNAVDVAQSTSNESAFGESVPYVPLSQRTQQPDVNTSSGGGGVSSSSEVILDDTELLLKQNRLRNIAVAVASFSIAIFNYGWQLTHPVTAVEILATMQSQSAPLTAIGNNGKPTVIDFWAPWCSNCKVAAPTLQAVEKEYGDRVNFIMVNGDEGRNWPLIELFGVDAIPHLALVSGEGDVETALIGPMSKRVLEADIDALLEKRGSCDSEVVTLTKISAPVCHEELPYTMLDTFENRPESRRINFVRR